MDWNACKTEYITDENASYRTLAAKYGVSATAIGNRSRAEGWVSDRERYLRETCSKMIESASREQVRRATRIATVADNLLVKIEEAIEDFDMAALLTDRAALKQITGALKDLKDIQGIKSEADAREQEARIAKLQREAAQEDSGPEEIVVTFGSDEDVGKWAE